MLEDKSVQEWYGAGQPVLLWTRRDEESEERLVLKSSKE